MFQLSVNDKSLFNINHSLLEVISSNLPEYSKDVKGLKEVYFELLNEDEVIQKNVANYSDLPKDIVIHIFKECNSNVVSVLLNNTEYITYIDIDIIKHLIKFSSVDNLDVIANYVEKLHDKNRQIVSVELAKCPHNSVKLTLSKNYEIPRKALEELVKDGNDIEVIRNAKEKLESCDR